MNVQGAGGHDFNALMGVAREARRLGDTSNLKKTLESLDPETMQKVVDEAKKSINETPQESSLGKIGYGEFNLANFTHRKKSPITGLYEKAIYTELKLIRDIGNEIIEDRKPKDCDNIGNVEEIESLSNEYGEDSFRNADHAVNSLHKIICSAEKIDVSELSDKFEFVLHDWTEGRALIAFEKPGQEASKEDWNQVFHFLQDNEEINRFKVQGKCQSKVEGYKNDFLNPTPLGIKRACK